MSLTRARRAMKVRHNALAGEPDVWLVGPWELAAFGALRGQLDPPRKWPITAELGATLQAIDAAATAPEVILLAEPRPGIHRQAMVDALTAAAPLARIVVVAGSWCEGELRSGRPLTGVMRLYYHQLSAWWRSELAARIAGATPAWSTLAGASRTTSRNPVGPRLATQRVVINTNDAAVFESLQSVLRDTGATCHWESHKQPSVDSPHLGIWDGGQLDADEQRRLAIFCQHFAHHAAPVLVLLDYPRPEHDEAIVQAGASALLGKPYSVDALIDALARLAANDENAA